MQQDGVWQAVGCREIQGICRQQEHQQLRPRGRERRSEPGVFYLANFAVKDY